MPNMLFTVPTANGQRASIALEECGIEYEVRTIDLLKGEHRSPEMLERNPIGRMPVLSTGEGDLARNIYGSLAIGSWAAIQADRLIPTGDAAYDYHQWMGVVMTDLAPAFASNFILDVLAETPQIWGVGWFTDVLERLLSAIDGQLAENPYVAGDTYTLVDVMLYPAATSSLGRIRDRLPEFANLERWAATIGQREAVVRGMAASQ